MKIKLLALTLGAPLAAVPAQAAEFDDNIKFPGDGSGSLIFLQSFDDPIPAPRPRDESLPCSRSFSMDQPSCQSMFRYCGDAVTEINDDGRMVEIRERPNFDLPPTMLVGRRVHVKVCTNNTLWAWAFVCSRNSGPECSTGWGGWVVNYYFRRIEPQDIATLKPLARFVRPR